MRQRRSFRFRPACLALVCSVVLSGQVANEDFFKGDPVQVMLACSDRAQALKPNNSRLMAENGRAYLAAGDRAQAQAILAAAEREDRFDPATFRLIAEAWLKVGEQAPVPGLLKRAKEFQNEWRDPASSQFAALLMDHGMIREARDAMAAGFRQEADWEYAVTFARACLRKGLREDAAEWFTRAVNLRKGRPDIWHHVALALADAGCAAPSVPASLPIPHSTTPSFFLQDPASVMIACTDAFRPAKELEPNVLAEDGLVHLVAGDRPGAEACFQQAIKADPEDGSTYVIIGGAWLRCGHRAEALAVFSEMQRKDPEGGSSFMKAALALLRAGEEAEASVLMEKGAALEPALWVGPGDFAKEALTQGRRDLAARWFARELAAGTADWSAWNDVALGFADLRLKSAQLPVMAEPRAHRLWLSMPLELELPDPKLGSAGLTFAAIYPDRNAFKDEVARQVRAALPAARPLPDQAPADAKGDGQGPLLSDDRRVTVERFQAAGGTRMDGKRSFAFEDAIFILELRDGTGHLLRSLTFQDSTEPGRALGIPQADLAGPSPRLKARSFKETIESACHRMTAFLASPAFNVWAD
ncbi:MAG TPA: hypothetical protein VJ463_00660 [Geothrix sp.]|nr:hypothetical protein [Geothrix sp.]